MWVFETVNVNEKVKILYYNDYMNGRKKPIIALSISAVLLLALYYLAMYLKLDLKTLLLDNLDLLLTVSSWLITFLTFYYFKNDRFYLWIHANIISHFKRTHSRWRIDVAYNCEKNLGNYESILGLVKTKTREIYPDKIKIREDLTNKLSLIVDDEYDISVTIEETQDFYKVMLKTSKTRIPSYMYSERFEELADYLEGLETTLRPLEKNYVLFIEFPDKNPYLGLLLKHLPDTLIKSLNISIVLPGDGSVTMEAQKSNVIITSDSFRKVTSTAKDLLSYAPSLAIQ